MEFDMMYVSWLPELRLRRCVLYILRMLVGSCAINADCVCRRLQRLHGLAD